MYITLADLCQFTIVILTTVGLTATLVNKKKKPPHPHKVSGYFLAKNFGRQPSIGSSSYHHYILSQRQNQEKLVFGVLELLYVALFYFYGSLKS